MPKSFLIRTKRSSVAQCFQPVSHGQPKGGQLSPSKSAALALLCFSPKTNNSCLDLSVGKCRFNSSPKKMLRNVDVSKPKNEKLEELISLTTDDSRSVTSESSAEISSDQSSVGGHEKFDSLKVSDPTNCMWLMSHDDVTVCPSVQDLLSLTPPSTPFPQKVYGPNDIHVCPECGKRYSTSSNLTRHRQIHRSVTDKKARKCPHCDKVYVSVPAYSMHIRTHTQGCQCHYCGKCFSRPWLLQGHIRTHTGEKPFTCQVCHKSFADKSNLRAHVQTHSMTKPFLCKRCNKAFALKSYLYKHQESSCIRTIRSSLSTVVDNSCNLDGSDSNDDEPLRTLASLATAMPSKCIDYTIRPQR